MKAGLALVRPGLVDENIQPKGKVALGTVKGDLHDIGKNLVGIMLRGAGFDVVDLGKDVPAERFVEAAKSEGAKVIGMSALLTTTMPVMKNVVDLLRAENLNESIKVITGGAPVTDGFAREIGADAYAHSAIQAVDRVKQLTSV